MGANLGPSLDPFTIGMITAATATIYCVFLVYFDWMRHLQLPALRQQIWTALHYPFHLSLVLFMRGFTQLILFGKAFNVLDQIADGWQYDPTPGTQTLDDLTNASSRAMAEDLANKTDLILTLYPPQDMVARLVVNHSIANISMIPDATWPKLQQWLTTSNDSATLDDATVAGFTTLVEQVIIIYAAIANSVSKSFGIDVGTEVKAKHPGDSNPIKLAENEVTIGEKTRQRARLVFAYTYVACGCTLVLLVMMALVSRMAPLGRLPRMRFVICTLFGVGIALAAVVFFAPDKADAFLDSAWPIPAIALGWLVVTVLVHVRGGGGGHRSRRPALDTVRRIVGLFRPRRNNKKDKEEAPRDDADSQRVMLRFWPPTRENTDLSAAETLQGAAGGTPRGRRVSFRDVSPKGLPRLDSADSRPGDAAGHDHRKADGSDYV